MKNFHEVIKSNENDWLKTYIDMNADLRKKTKTNFEKIFWSWWIMQFLEKLFKMWKNIEILNLSQQKKQRTILYQNQIIIQRNFFWKSITDRKEKTQTFMNKPVYLGLSVLELSKLLMYEFWYECDKNCWIKAKNL